ncbi:cytochrome P450 2B11-like isoform X1 [Lontra canadensis]|uniref:cytochrome P450 2B11-like isoform X1 n=1 Tax=Lontra canadensis TaxID=76717 RepID=UPI0013F31525|nr:cytochrome P450 2B11-like isoform X1 [Lontra canadensis]
MQGTASTLQYQPRGNRLWELLASLQMFEVFSGILKYSPGIHRDVYSKVREIEDFVIKNIQRHREMLDPSAPKDFIDSFLVRMDKESSDPESEFHFKDLVYTVVSLFLAGTESSSNTLLHGFVLLLKNPDVVEKVQEEIDRVIGSHHLPALEDRAKMPYTDAVIHEIQRFSDVLPLGLPRCVIKDTHFWGYHLPKVRPQNLGVALWFMSLVNGSQ